VQPAGVRPCVLGHMTPLRIGSRVGVFRIDALLGVGGMGELYPARDTKLNRDVAISQIIAGAYRPRSRERSGTIT
jgi:serine/threonine protein kinase